MTKRQISLEYARIAGYHGDKAKFTRLLIESRVAAPAMHEAWRIGVRQRETNKAI